ncbi:GNAT family N-acetyltransferase [Oricola sp.]|uniref:GNAT family N-acetyltransferase n=1 Tax=Oricola sp. TaxID=1979950 RepID=UPI0025DF5E02|nr:GNAT family N-acetyltransferase [Oricola sp.]MCI5074755.1 GNAT family N-acetyltransferase [Oricola sp.]
MTISISLAETEDEVEAVRDLCRDFVSWQLEAFPEKRETILAYFDPVSFEEALAELPAIHARPGGAILLATEDAQPLGCISYKPLESGAAEVKRLFVSPSARGKGVGGALVEAMIGEARADGYRELRLDTADFLTDACRLYHRHGFEDVTPPATPGAASSHAVFMRRAL